MNLKCNTLIYCRISHLWCFAELYFYELYCETNWYQGLHENTGQFSVSKLVSLHCMYVYSMLGLKYKGELSDSEHGTVVVARRATLNIPETADLLRSSHTVVSSVYRKLHNKMSRDKTIQSKPQHLTWKTTRKKMCSYWKFFNNTFQYCNSHQIFS